ncbi:DMT family transporter [Curvivirga aplysinae]|uniref:DMT family transporter n=1 Tax=Curvivirga aplysinae TaxID=2529852 RepID=UPI0012BB8634|nr:DMT family transporter [Curvivirga aplysinae]MTI09697.1 DMT family transporter [Curvivirga aplysinae]
MRDIPVTETEPDHGISSLAMFLLIASPIFMASNMIVARFMAGEFPPFAMAFWRWAICFLIMLPFVGKYLWQHRAIIWAEKLQLAILGAMGMGVCGAFVYIGGQTTTATNIGLVYASSPLMIIAISAAFFDEKQRPIQIIGIILGAIGLVTIVAKGDFNVLLNLNFTSGDLWILAASTGWAIYSLYLKFHPSKLATTPRLAAIILFGVMVLFPFTIWEGMTFATPEITQKNILAILFLALFPALAAYLAYSKLQTLVTASIAGLTLYLTPISNSIMAWIILGEGFQTFHWIGSVFILLGLWMTTMKKKKKQ